MHVCTACIIYKGLRVHVLPIRYKKLQSVQSIKKKDALKEVLLQVVTTNRTLVVLLWYNFLFSRASANAKRDYSNLYCVCMYVECMCSIAR